MLAAGEEAVAIHREFTARRADAHLHELERSLLVVAGLENGDDVSHASRES
jgi:hypothetical protein